MGRSRRLLLLLSLVAAMTAVTGTSDSEVIVARCYPPPTPTVAGSDGAYLPDLLLLLRALPSAAAQTGFASMRTGGAFARGLCFGDPAPDQCLGCLSDAARKITEQCGDASRGAGCLDGGCFLGCADPSASSAGADDIGGVVFSGDAVPRDDVVDVRKLVAVAQSLVPRSADGRVPAADATTPASNGDTARVLAQCAPDRASAECSRCLREAALQMAKSWGLTAVQGRVAAVLRPNCYLRFEISTPTPPLSLREKIQRKMKDNIGLIVCIAVVIVLGVGALVGHVRSEQRVPCLS